MFNEYFIIDFISLISLVIVIYNLMFLKSFNVLKLYILVGFNCK